MLFLTPNDQCQSTEGNIWNSRLMQQSNIHHHFTDTQHCVWSQSQSVSNSMWLCLSVSQAPVCHTATPTLHCLASHTVHQPTVSRWTVTHSLTQFMNVYVRVNACEQCRVVSVRRKLNTVHAVYCSNCIVHPALYSCLSTAYHVGRVYMQSMRCAAPLRMQCLIHALVTHANTAVFSPRGASCSLRLTNCVQSLTGKLLPCFT